MGSSEMEPLVARRRTSSDQIPEGLELVWIEGFGPAFIELDE